ncbi:hypothetical protein D3C86_2025050 [compost metagenome]
MKGHHRVAVGGDDPGTGINKCPMRLQHELRCFDQRQRRPFRLAKRRADALQLAPHAAIEQTQAKVTHWLELTVGAEAASH